MLVIGKKKGHVKDQVSRLKSELHEKDIEIRRLRVRNAVAAEHRRHDDLEGQFKHLMNKLKLSEQKVVSLHQEKMALQYEIELLRNIVDLEEIPDEHLAVADALARAKQSEEEVFDCKDKLSTALQDTADAREEAGVAQKELVSVRTQAQLLFSKIEIYEHEFNNIVEEKEQIEGKLHMNQRDLKQSKNLHEQMSLQCTELLEYYRGLEGALQVSEEKADHAQKEVKDAKNLLQQTEKELARCKEIIIELERNEIDAMKVHPKLEELKCANDRFQNQLLEISEMLRSFNAENESLQRRVMELESSKSTDEKTLMDLEVNLEDSKKMCKTLSNEILKKCNEIEKKGNENMILAQKIVQLKKELTSVKATLDQEIKSHEGSKKLSLMFSEKYASLKAKIRNKKEKHDKIKNKGLAETSSEVALVVSQTPSPSTWRRSHTATSLSPGSDGSSNAASLTSGYDTCSSVVSRNTATVKKMDSMSSSYRLLGDEAAEKLQRILEMSADRLRKTRNVGGTSRDRRNNVIEKALVL